MSDDHDEDGTAGTTEKTFTKAEMARMVNAQVRAKVAAALAEIGDIDELKAKAAQADKQKTQLDKIQEQLAAQIERAEKADEANLRREIADKLGLSVAQVGRLKGKTREELMADGEAYIEENGITPKGKTSANTDDKSGDADTDKGKTKADTDDDGDRETRPTRRTGRPREELRSGAPVTGARDDTDDPRELAAKIPRF